MPPCCCLFLESCRSSPKGNTSPSSILCIHMLRWQLLEEIALLLSKTGAFQLRFPLKKWLQQVISHISGKSHTFLASLFTQSWFSVYLMSEIRIKEGVRSWVFTTDILWPWALKTFLKYFLLKWPLIWTPDSRELFTFAHPLNWLLQEQRTPQSLRSRSSPSPLKLHKWIEIVTNQVSQICPPSEPHC